MKEYKTEKDKKRFYKSGIWSKVRQQALARDNHECQPCKREGRVHVDSIKVEGERKSIQLNVHHIKELEHHPKFLRGGAIVFPHNQLTSRSNLCFLIPHSNT